MLSATAGGRSFCWQSFCWQSFCWQSFWPILGCLILLATGGAAFGQTPATAVPVEPSAGQRFATALATLRAGQPQLAADALAELGRETAPGNPALAAEALFKAAQLYDEQLNRPAVARALYLQTAQQYPGSRFAERAQRRGDELLQLLASDPAVLGEFNQLTAAYLTLGTTAVIARLRRLLEQHPRFAQADRATYLLGSAYRDAGAAGDAAQTLHRVLLAYPESPWAPYAGQALAALALRQGDYASARQHFHQLSQYGPPLWTVAAQQGLAACQRALWQKRAAQASWLYLLVVGAALAFRGRRQLLPPPLEVLYYVPVASFLLLVAGITKGGSVRAPMAGLALGGTLLAWLSGAAARRPTRLWSGALIRVVAATALLYVVIYQGDLLDLLIQTWLMGAETG